jgi:hypothetical protein
VRTFSPWRGVHLRAHVPKCMRAVVETGPMPWLTPDLPCGGLILIRRNLVKAVRVRFGPNHHIRSVRLFHGSPLGISIFIARNGGSRSNYHRDE